MEALRIISKFSGEAISPDGVRTVYAGEEGVSQEEKNLEQKILILLGLEGSDSSGVIDAMCNTFYGTTFESEIRYKIANERFDLNNSVKDGVVKYVFYGTKLSYIPVIVDVPSISGKASSTQPEAYQLVHNFINSEAVPHANSLAILFPKNIQQISPETEGKLIQILSLFSLSLRKAPVLIFSFNDDLSIAESPILERILIDPIQSLHVFADNNTLFIAPDKREKQKQKQIFQETMKFLSVLALHLGNLPPLPIAGILMETQSQSTQHELSIYDSLVLNKNKSTTISLANNDENSAKFPIKSTPETLIFTKPKILDDYSGNLKTAKNEDSTQCDDSNCIEVKHYVYDEITRSYQMNFISKHNTSISSTPCPSPALPYGAAKTDFRQELNKLIENCDENIEASPTEDSEMSSLGLQRGAESARSTASEWKYTPSNGGTLHTTTTFDANKLALPIVPEIPKVTENTIYQLEAPPKPARKGEFQVSEEQVAGFQRGASSRQARRSLTSLQKKWKAVQEQQQNQQGSSATPNLQSQSNNETQQNIAISLPSTNQHVLQGEQQPNIQISNRQNRPAHFSSPPPPYPYEEFHPMIIPQNPKPLPFSQEPRRKDKQSGRDITKYCFYIFAPIFIILVVLSIVITLAFS